MKKGITILLFMIALFGVLAQNPIGSAGVYISDPSANVWKDGKLYVYGSVDEISNFKNEK